MAILCNRIFTLGCWNLTYLSGVNKSELRPITKTLTALPSRARNLERQCIFILSIMSEFKGTKGKWSTERDYDKKYDQECININVDNNIEGLCTVWSGFKKNSERTEADALLISKSPEMLYMLTSFVNGCDEIGFDDIDPEYYYNMFKQLIKEATEL